MPFNEFTFKKSLQTELNHVFKNGETCTKSAFCQARKKLKLCFFQDFFDQTVLSFYKYQPAKTFKNYRLWACDTSVQLLPNNQETCKIGVHKNQFKEVASVKISAYFDVHNKLITQFGLFDKRRADLICCIEKQVKIVPKDVIAIYDRGYGSQILPFFHDSYGTKYVIRLKTDFSNVVKSFMQSTENELLVTEPISEKTYKRLAEMGIRKSQKDMVSYRLVKVPLNTGETEILMTNLDNSFSINDLAEIYRLRWGIETCFFCVKNHQMLGTFSGYSALAVKQDIYVNLLFYNLQTIAQTEAEKKLATINARRKKKGSKNKKRDHEGYQLNRNVGTNTLRMYLSKLFTVPEGLLEKLLQEMDIYFLQSLEKIKPNKKERGNKKIRQNDRHHTELNYKRGF